MQQVRSYRRAAAIALAAGSCAMAGANPDPNDQPQGQLVFPVAGEDHQTQVFVVGNDGLVMPDHPPIDQIPPMPMPEPADFDGLPGDDSVMLHDATTGETIVLPWLGSSGAESGEGGSTFTGVLNTDIGEPGVAENFGFMSLAGSLTSFPRSPNCKLVMKFTDQGGQTRYFVCSGSMNDASTVLTAAHCVYARNPNGINIFDWADAIWIYPAWDGNGDTTDPVNTQIIQNFGWCTMSHVIAGSAYVNSGDWDRDCAAIGVSDRSIGMLTGWFGWAWGGCNLSVDHHNFSYPSETCSGSLHNGQDMYYWFGDFDSCPDNQLHLDTNSGCFGAVWGGMSGSAAYYISGDGRYSHAVCSTSDRDDDANYCKLWEQFTIDMESLKTTVRGGTFDLELLGFRKSNTTVQAGTSFSDATVHMVNATNNNPAARLVTFRIYLSTNADISTGDTLLATWVYDLNFGSMHDFLAAIPATTIPITTPPGTYYLGAILDSGTDGNTANNDTDGWDCQRITVTVGLPAAPSGPNPADNATGISTVADLDWAASARATSYDVYFGTDSTPDVGEFLGTVATSSFTLPVLSSNTHYYWQIVARNSSGSVAGPVWDFVTQTPPDLNAILCDAPDAPNNVFYRGESFVARHSERNDGQLPSGGYFLEFRVSPNNTISTGDLLIDNVHFTSLAAGQSRTANESVTLPGAMNPGVYYLGTRLVPQDGSSTSWVSDNDTITVLKCNADISGSSDPRDPTYGVPDAVIDSSDFFYFLDQFAQQNAAVADISGSSDPSDPAYGVPDGIIDAADFFTYLDYFVTGCPGL